MPSSIDECDYFTKRMLENDGYVIAWVFKGEDTMHIKYKCPKCGYEGVHEAKYEKKSKKAIRFKCPKCGRTFIIGKLRKSKRLA